METGVNGLNPLYKNNDRPRFLNLWQISLPVMGWVSIFHRITGLLLFLLLPLFLYLLQLSLVSAEGFQRAMHLATSLPARLLGVMLLWVLLHHLLAGLRVMAIDREWGSGLQQARRSACMVLVGTAVAVILFVVGL